MSRAIARDLTLPPGSADVHEELISYPLGRRIQVSMARERTWLVASGAEDRTYWTLSEQGGVLALDWAGPCAGEPDEPHLLAALEASLTWFPDHSEVTCPRLRSELSRLLHMGVDEGATRPWPTVARTVLWQLPDLWLPSPSAPYPLRYRFTNGRRHPGRPYKPDGAVYHRYIPWLAKTLTFRTVSAERDLHRFHRWMNDPEVARFWQEQGPPERHRAYLEAIAADPHVISLIGCFDGEPFGYFEVYWAKEDRISPFYDVHDFDRGWHVLIGEPRFRGRPYLTAWMPAISHYLFLDDCRTQRIVIEPRTDNEKMIRSLGRCGYALLKEIEFPHKRALLGMLSRERFFSEALWIPRTAPSETHPVPVTSQAQ